MRKWQIGVAVGVVLVALTFGVRSCNMNKKKQLAESTTEVATAVTEVVTEEPTTTEEDYQSSLNLNKDKGKDGRIEVTEAPTTEAPPPEQTEPNYAVDVCVFDHTTVPVRNVDGSSCNDYFDAVTLDDFGSYWGKDLTKKDFLAKKKVLVGVDQNPKDVEKYDLQSVGWLKDNLKSLDKNTAVKFTNLHIIGSLSNTHVALLCSYDWYSVFGLRDTLVVFEDISGQLNVKDFKEGDIFSATVFAHNIKRVDVNGQSVICVQYNVFK